MVVLSITCLGCRRISTYPTGPRLFITARPGPSRAGRVVAGHVVDSGVRCRLRGTRDPLARAAGECVRAGGATSSWLLPTRSDLTGVPHMRAVTWHGRRDVRVDT